MEGIKWLKKEGLVIASLGMGRSRDWVVVDEKRVGK